DRPLGHRLGARNSTHGPRVVRWGRDRRTEHRGCRGRRAHHGIRAGQVVHAIGIAAFPTGHAAATGITAGLVETAGVLAAGGLATATHAGAASRAGEVAVAKRGKSVV